MFKINKDDQSIHITRGDIAVISVSASDGETEHLFQPGDVVQINVFKRKKCEEVVMRKAVEVAVESAAVDIELTSEDTKIGGYISKPTEYWYEVELNPDTEPQTLVGYDDEAGAKVFMLYPEGGESK